jgi:hypothetical protein
MKALRRIWQDIRRGENIDLYLTVTLAFGVGILGILGAAPQAWVASITLAGMGVLAVAALRSEHRSAELAGQLDRLSETFFQDEFPANLKDDFLQADEAWLVGVNLARTVKTYYPDIEVKLHAGQRVRALLVQPDGPAAEMADGRVYGRSNPERMRAEIRATLDDLSELRRIAPDRLEIRTIQTPLTYGAMAIDPSGPGGKLYLEHYSYKMPGGSKPKFVLHTGRDAWYTFFRDELRALWEHGEEWQ